MWGPSVRMNLLLSLQQQLQVAATLTAAQQAVAAPSQQLLLGAMLAGDNQLQSGCQASVGQDGREPQMGRQRPDERPLDLSLKQHNGAAKLCKRSQAATESNISNNDVQPDLSPASWSPCALQSAPQLSSSSPAIPARRKARRPKQSREQVSTSVSTTSEQILGNEMTSLTNGGGEIIEEQQARQERQEEKKDQLQARQQQQQRGRSKKGTQRSHLCQFCGRSFSRSDMLARHSRLHTNTKPYQCNKCLLLFSRSDHLSTHDRTHTGEKPYQCNFCSYSACRRDMITRHMRTHTGQLSSATSTTGGRTRRTSAGGRRRPALARRRNGVRPSVGEEEEEEADVSTSLMEMEEEEEEEED